MRRRWVPKMRTRREPLAPELRTLLELGPAGVRAAHGRSSLDCGGDRICAAAWREHGEAIISAWVREHPGTRPAGWWSYAAMEPRRCILGAELLLPTPNLGDWEHVWRARFGVPAFRQSRPRGYRGLPVLESEPKYLARLGLLGAEERVALADDALDPKVINPFIVDAEDNLISEGK